MNYIFVPKGLYILPKLCIIDPYITLYSVVKKCSENMLELR